MSQDTIEQAVRVSHCAHPFPESHACIGSCKITPKGIELECTLCGDGEEQLTTIPGYTRLSAILRCMGIGIEYLEPGTVRIMLRELTKT